MARNTPTPHLDALRDMGGLPVIRTTPLKVYAIPGSLADAIGAAGIQDLANQHERPIIVDGPSEFHASKIFRPKAA